MTHVSVSVYATFFFRVLMALELVISHVFSCLKANSTYRAWNLNMWKDVTISMYPDSVCNTWIAGSKCGEDMENALVTIAPEE